VLGDFNVVGMVVLPDKTDSVLIVDSNAVPTFLIALQGFQPIARWDQEIVKSLGAVQRHKTAKRHLSDINELLYSFPVEQTLRLAAPEALDHFSRLPHDMLYVKRTNCSVSRVFQWRNPR
jgi:hypothetical protein